MYGVLTKWHAGTEPAALPSQRSVHHRDFRHVVVRHWNKYDPASTVPDPAGSFVTHVGKGIHYDGAKEGDVVLEIVGMGAGDVGAGRSEVEPTKDWTTRHGPRAQRTGIFFVFSESVRLCVRSPRQSV